jgi:hypothetical protein
MQISVVFSRENSFQPNEMHDLNGSLVRSYSIGKNPLQHNSYSIIELQGKIETSSDADAEQTICKLFFEPNGAPYLVIGKQKLVGKRIKLAKPMAITHIKVKAEESAPSCSSLEVVGFVWEKLLFDARPTLNFE